MHRALVIVALAVVVLVASCVLLAVTMTPSATSGCNHIPLTASGQPVHRCAP